MDACFDAELAPRVYDHAAVHAVAGGGGGAQRWSQECGRSGEDY